MPSVVRPARRVASLVFGSILCVAASLHRWLLHLRIFPASASAFPLLPPLSSLP